MTLGVSVPCRHQTHEPAASASSCAKEARAELVLPKMKAQTVWKERGKRAYFFAVYFVHLLDFPARKLWHVRASPRLADAMCAQLLAQESAAAQKALQ